MLPSDSVTTIFDVGANIGASCVYWIDCYPNAKVYAYEPCVASYTLLCENTAKMPVEAYNIALGGEDGFGTLHHGVEDHVCDSLTPHLSRGSEKVVIERARRHLHGPCDILKIDTEGSETAILSDVAAWIPDFKVLYLEYHSEHDRLKFDELMKGSHALWHSHAERPHRGEVCYVRKDLIPDDYNQWQIRS